MDTTWIDRCALSFPGAEKRYQLEWEATLFEVGGKMFAMLGGDKEEKPILSVKAEPAMGELLRREHEGGIIPGYYLNKTHWNSIYLESGVPQELMEKMLRASYELVLSGLPKKRQREIDPSRGGAYPG